MGRQAERALLIQVGAAAELRDRLAETAQTYTNLTKVTRELNRFERRGEARAEPDPARRQAAPARPRARRP